MNAVSNQVINLAGVDDTEAVDVPTHGVTDFSYPPVVIFAESDDAPIERCCGVCHIADEVGRSQEKGSETRESNHENTFLKLLFNLSLVFKRMGSAKMGILRLKKRRFLRFKN